MKAIYLFLTLLCTLILSSCSTMDEPTFVDNGTIPNEEMDSITFNISFEDNLSTRSGLDILSGYSYADRNTGEWTLKADLFSFISESNYYCKINPILFNTEDNTFSIPKSLYDKESNKGYRFTDIVDNDKKNDDKKTFIINIPKSVNKRNLKLCVGITPFENKDYSYYYESSLYNHSELYHLPFSLFTKTINSIYNNNGIFEGFNSQKKDYGKGYEYCNFENSLYTSFPALSYYASENLFDENNNLINQISLKGLSSWVVVLTDEFNEKQPGWWTKATSYGGMIPYPAFDLVSFAILDWNPNRKLAECIPGISFEGTETKTPKLSSTDFIIKSYETPILNPIKKIQYNILDELKYDERMDWFSIFENEEIRRTDVPFTDGKHWVWLKENSSNRYFQPLASRRITMPYGKPKTLNSTIDAFSHYNNNEINKSIDYLIVNAFPLAGIGNKWDKEDDTFINKWYRFVYPIPEEGFKPNTLYIIKNKPGTKLFKEWDEANATTRSGDDSEYIVDPNSIEIEEIPM